MERSTNVNVNQIKSLGVLQNEIGTFLPTSRFLESGCLVGSDIIHLQSTPNNTNRYLYRTSLGQQCFSYRPKIKQKL